MMKGARLATIDDCEALVELSLTENAGRWVDLAFERNPKVLAESLTSDSNAEVIVLTDRKNGAVYGTGERHIKTVYLNGKFSCVGYLGGLKIAANKRNGLGLYDGFCLLRRLHEDNPLSNYFTTIIKGNRVARDVLVSGRAHLPHYYSQGNIVTFNVNRTISRFSPLAKNEELICGSDLSLDEILRFYAEHGSKRDFFPAFDTLPSRTTLRNFYGVKMNGKLIALGALIKRKRLLRHPLDIVI